MRLVGPGDVIRDGLGLLGIARGQGLHECDADLRSHRRYPTSGLRFRRDLRELVSETDGRDEVDATLRCFDRFLENPLARELRRHDGWRFFDEGTPEVGAEVETESTRIGIDHDGKIGKCLRHVGVELYCHVEGCRLPHGYAEQRACGAESFDEL